MHLSDLGPRFILIHEGGASKYAVGSATGSYQIHNLAPHCAITLDITIKAINSGATPVGDNGNTVQLIFFGPDMYIVRAKVV